MNQIEFNEDQLGNLGEIAAQLFADSNVPGTPGYQRVLVRPKINWFSVALNTLLPPFLCTLLCLVSIRIGFSFGIALAMSLALLFSYMFIRAKSILICIVKIYQRLAPASIRNRCRFEPSCSQYMIECLNKYGLFKGLKKGLNRLKRCNIHNGGFDLP